MLKQLIPLLLVMAAVAALATTHTGDYALVRPAGSGSYPTSYAFIQVFDSTDTFQVDTFYSDTVTIDTSTNWVNYCLYVHTAPSQPDSANDSIVWIVKAYAEYSTGRAERLVARDSIGTTGTIAVGDTIWRNVNVDTLIFNRLYFESVVSDSFIMGEGIDTATYYLTIEVLQQD